MSSTGASGRFAARAGAGNVGGHRSAQQLEQDGDVSFVTGQAQVQHLARRGQASDVGVEAEDRPLLVVGQVAADAKQPSP